MNMNVLLAAAFVAVMTATNSGASYKEFHIANGIHYYVDIENMIRSDDESIVWTREEEPAPLKHKVEFATEFQMKLSCSKNKITILQSITYRSNGEILYRNPGSQESSIIPGSHYSLLADIVCGRKFLP